MFHQAARCAFFTAFLSVGVFNSVIAAPLHDAAAAGDLAEVERLLNEGAEVDPQRIATPLYFAAQRGHVEVVALLVDRGADVNALSKFGTALQTAARGNHVRIVEILLENGADLNIPGGNDKNMPLHEAAARGAIEAALLLLQHGADVNSRTSVEYPPPIHLAAFNGKDAMVELLLEHGASPTTVEPLAPGELAAADLEQGRLRAIVCGECHPVEKGTTPTGLVTGPDLWNIVGRQKASLPDYPYSAALTNQAGIWSYEELNRFIADPLGYAPGTNMEFGFEPDRSMRVPLIAYLRTLSNNPVPLE